MAKVESTTRFFTDSGIEVPALTAGQMREVDRIAMEETGPNFFQMMENAGRNLAMLAIEVLGGGWEKAKIITLAGGGGNGGGGICASRHLANRNANVKLCLTMTLALPKTGLLPRNSGQLFLADIGIPEGTYRRLGLSYTSPFGDRFQLPLTWR